ncbi:hypothetical protein NIES21_14580 [Anabaenopsis circularis NIES-21]|uniref:CopG domain protein DNA-binding domain protein n=1 Tax=Anabaenopsis circularis NIES-21 TaxID=1085406 RepID=A0A1Z4GDQ5_9CYAN|nr:hypothetical protein NIES21_14580 [Anabaenopsis circularis NIES-21]
MDNKRDTVIRLRVNPNERQIVQQAAQAKGITISDLVRQNVGLPTLGKK